IAGGIPFLERPTRGAQAVLGRLGHGLGRPSWRTSGVRRWRLGRRWPRSTYRRPRHRRGARRGLGCGALSLDRRPAPLLRTSSAVAGPVLAAEISALGGAVSGGMLEWAPSEGDGVAHRGVQGRRSSGDHLLGRGQGGVCRRFARGARCARRYGGRMTGYRVLTGFQPGGGGTSGGLSGELRVGGWPLPNI